VRVGNCREDRGWARWGGDRTTKVTKHAMGFGGSDNSEFLAQFFPSYFSSGRTKSAVDCVDMVEFLFFYFESWVVLVSCVSRVQSVDSGPINCRL